MKKITKILSLLLALVFAMTAFVACGGETVIIEEGGKDYVQIQWVWGQVVLKEEYVERGSYLTPWTPEVEGREFEGWYSIPLTVRKFNFEKMTADESMRIYALFSGRPVDIETQMPDWYLIGTGKGDLLKSNWSHEKSAQHLGLYPDDAGIYKVTLELYSGDAFKMARNLEWSDPDQRTIENMKGYADGSVKDDNGNVVFTAGDNNNIVVADGMDGKYEITFDPIAEELNFTLLQSLESKPDDIRLIGSFNGWYETYGENDYKFTSEDNVIWTYEWEATAGTKFKLFNNISKGYYPSGMGNDLEIKNDGKYTITFNIKTQEIVVTDENGNKVDVGTTGGNTGGGTSDGANLIRFAGNFNDWANTTSDWNLTKGDDGVWRGTLTITEDMYADWSVNEGASELSAAVKLYNPGTQKWYAHTGDANLFLTAGTYHFKCVESNSNFVYWRDGEAEPATPAGGTTGGNGGSSNYEGETIRIYFKNNWAWPQVNCHWWGSQAGGESQWPGNVMNKVEGSTDMYYLDVPADITGLLFNGQGSYGEDKSEDVKTGIFDGAAWEMLWDETTQTKMAIPITYAP